MKKIVIHHIGPVNHVELNLKRINVIIGPQSAGKSCILKIACFCAWLEKQIELLQAPIIVEEAGFWEDNLIGFHKLEGYMKKGNDSYFSYSTSTMIFTYHYDNNKFDFEWKAKGRWNYKRSRVSYIPAERNIVSVVPNWLDVSLHNDNIRNFISDWYMARQMHGYKNELSMLDLGVKYYYDGGLQTDMIMNVDGSPLGFSEASSGLHSLIPMQIYLDYLFDGQYNGKNPTKMNAESENGFVLQNIYSTKFKKGLNDKLKNGDAVYYKIGTVNLPFVSMEKAKECQGLYDAYTKTSFSDIYLEEPEQNLFPQTQVEFVYDIIRRSSVHNDCLFIATHSPYILYALNNCMQGYLVRAKLPNNLKSKANSWLNPKEVGVWELRHGELSSAIDQKEKTLQDEDGLIRGNYFDRIMHNIMADFTNYSAYYD